MPVSDPEHCSCDMYSKDYLGCDSYDSYDYCCDYCFRITGMVLLTIALLISAGFFGTQIKEYNQIVAIDDCHVNIVAVDLVAGNIRTTYNVILTIKGFVISVEVASRESYANNSRVQCYYDPAYDRRVLLADGYKDSYPRASFISLVVFSSIVGSILCLFTCITCCCYCHDIRYRNKKRIDERNTKNKELSKQKAPTKEVELSTYSDSSYNV